MLSWLGDRLPVHNDIFLVHGEEPSRVAFAAAARERFSENLPLRVPVMGETVRLSKTKPAKSLAKRPPVINPADTVADWHNLYAETILGLRHALEEAPSDTDRRKILERVSKTIQGRARGNK